MKLRDLPEDKVKVGIKVRSLADPQVIGEITELVWEDRYPPSVVIKWSNGKESWWWPWSLENEIVES